MTADLQIPTLDDVAKAAGVSTATVSRCLNAADKVSDHARTKVMEAVETLGYTPNFGARAMAAKRTFTIGAIIPTMENAIFARAIQAFQESLHEKGYTLLVSSSAYRADLEAEQIRALVARGADGILLIGYARDQEMYDYLKRRGVPTLVAWASPQEALAPAVGFDNRAAIFALADKVLSMGHRRIGFISTVLRGNDRAAERLKGVRDALVAHGVDPEEMQVVETTNVLENGGHAFAKIMQGPRRPTVVMCGNDVLAVGAAQRAHEMGLRVPEDVSITGFDDMELACVITPKLTTVHVPHRDMGSRAAVELVRMVEKESTGLSVDLDSSLRMRASLRALD